MEVYVNGQKLDFPIAEGMKVQDVMNELNTALGKYNKVAVKWEADGDTEESYLSRLASDFQKLEVTAEDIDLLAVDTITALSEHLDKIIRRLMEIKQISDKEKQINEVKAVKDNLIEAVKFMKNVIINSSKILKVDPNTISEGTKTLLDAVSELEKINYDDGAVGEKILNDYYVNIVRIKKLLPEILVQFKNLQMTDENKIKFLEDAGGDIDVISQGFLDAAISFQQDEKQKASELLQENTLKVQNIINLIKQSMQPAMYSVIKVEDETFQKWIEGFSEVLQATLEAFERNDEVELADMLEYEISPNIKKLGDYIKQLIAELQK